MSMKMDATSNDRESLITGYPNAANAGFFAEPAGDRMARITV